MGGSGGKHQDQHRGGNCDKRKKKKRDYDGDPKQHWHMQAADGKKESFTSHVRGYKHQIKKGL